MARTRSIKLALLTVALLAGFGTTFAWARGLVGGRRADRIGTFTTVTVTTGAPATGGATPRTVTTTTGAPGAVRPSVTSRTAPAPSTATTVDHDHDHDDSPGHSSSPADDDGRSGDD